MQLLYQHLSAFYRRRQSQHRLTFHRQRGQNEDVDVDVVLVSV